MDDKKNSTYALISSPLTVIETNEVLNNRSRRRVLNVTVQLPNCC